MTKINTKKNPCNYVSYTDFICLFIVCLSSLLHLLEVGILNIVLIGRLATRLLTTLEAL